MVLKKYNRTDEKENKRNLINQHLSDEIEEEYAREDFYKWYENDVEQSRLDDYISAYLHKNNFEKCKNCPNYECTLLYLNNCYTRGLKIKTIPGEKERQTRYKIRLL
jgi:hypothetical protein